MSTGSAWRRPVRAWPSVRRPRSARRWTSGTVARRTASQRGQRQNRCSASSSWRPQWGHAPPPFQRRA
eukprot:7915596-Lingulodinium_polyedra.AAC.1